MLNPNLNMKVLQQPVFTQSEIERLLEFRRHLWERQIVNIRRLEFVRWLIQTQRLTDQMNAHTVD